VLLIVIKQKNVTANLAVRAKVLICRVKNTKRRRIITQSVFSDIKTTK